MAEITRKDLLARNLNRMFNLSKASLQISLLSFSMLLLSQFCLYTQ